MLLQDLSFLDDDKEDRSESCINPVQILSTESIVQDEVQETPYVEEIQFEKE